MPNQHNKWTREELILTLSVYFQLPFGRLNHGTPEVMDEYCEGRAIFITKYFNNLGRTKQLAYLDRDFFYNELVAHLDDIKKINTREDILNK